MKNRKLFVLLAVFVLALVVAAPVFAQDGDGDGVLDGADECPGTGAGMSVDAVGCAEVSFTNVLGTVSGLFGDLGIETLIALGAVVAGVGLLARRVIVAAR